MSDVMFHAVGNWDGGLRGKMKPLLMDNADEHLRSVLILTANILTPTSTEELWKTDGLAGNESQLSLRTIMLQ